MFEKTWNPALFLSSWARASVRLRAKQRPLPITTLFGPAILFKESKISCGKTITILLIVLVRLNCWRWSSFTWKRHKSGKSKIKRSASSHLCVFLSFIHCAHYGLDLVNCVRHCAANLVHIKLESMGGLKILAFFEGDAGTHVTGGVGTYSKWGKKEPTSFCFSRSARRFQDPWLLIGVSWNSYFE